MAEVTIYTLLLLRPSLSPSFLLLRLPSFSHVPSRASNVHPGQLLEQVLMILGRFRWRPEEGLWSNWSLDKGGVWGSRGRLGS
jgi:hypothetical protein